MTLEYAQDRIASMILPYPVAEMGTLVAECSLPFPRVPGCFFVTLV